MTIMLYNCTEIYNFIVKFRLSIAFRIIYIDGHFSVVHVEKRPQKVTQVVVCRRSEHHDMFIVCQHQCCLRYCLGQGIYRSAPSLGNAPYCLQRVQFVANRLTIFAAPPRTMDRSNAKFGEGVKRLF